MQKTYLRTYNKFDIDEVKKHLLIVGDLSSDCASCQELGMDPYTVKSCSNCGAEFKYITSRRIESHSNERFQIVQRFKEKRPELIFIDFGDYSKAIGKKKAHDFFG